jgi:alcohol dehydrogenase, propanol-preferring
MKAIRFLGPGRPMELQEVPDPEPCPGWIKVRAAGLCHSDLHILDGSLTNTMVASGPDRRIAPRIQAP